jgi:hypothetical protein
MLCYRTIVALDIEGSTTRTNPAKAKIRELMYVLFEMALRESGIGEHHRDPFVDRGDGVLTLVRPTDEVPKTILLSQVIPRLTELLADCEDQKLRLRAVVHAGEVHYDTRGCFGETLDVSFRLLDAPEVKDSLRRSSSPLVLVVSDTIYRSLIRHRYDGIDESSFKPVVTVTVGEQEHRGWLLS